MEMAGEMYEYACHEGNHAMPGMLPVLGAWS